MAYPPRPLRRISFRQRENAGEDIDTAALDAEHNDFVEVINQIVTRLRGVTTAGGALKNLAEATAQALAGAQRIVATASQTVFETTITWQTAFSSSSVFVYVDGVQVDPNNVSVADDGGGDLDVTLSGVTIAGGEVVVVTAYEAGAGILTRLQTEGVSGEGAELVGLHDVDNYFSATTVEGALAEARLLLDTLISDLGTLSEIWYEDGQTADGTPNAATANWDMGTNRITNAGDGVDDQDYATLKQVKAITGNLSSVVSLFIRKDGSVDFTANQSMGGHKLADLAAATNDNDALRFIQAKQRFLAQSGTKSTTAEGTVTGPLTLGAAASDTADVDQAPDPVSGVAVPTIYGVPTPAADDQVVNKVYVDDAVADVTQISELAATLGIFPNDPDGSGIDGDSPGLAISQLDNGGVFHFQAFATQAAESPSRDTYIYCTESLTTTHQITSASGYDVYLYCDGNINIASGITARNITIYATGNVTVSAGTLSADADVGVVDIFCGGVLDLDDEVIAPDIRIQASDASSISSLLRAKRTLSSPDADDRYAGADGADGPGGGGGAGGTGGGNGGENTTGSNGAGGISPTRQMHRPYLLPLAPGGDGAASTTAGIAAVPGGGTIRVWCGGDLDLTGAELSCDGTNSDGSTNGAGGGGGGGAIRIAANGVITGGNAHAIGGAGGDETDGSSTENGAGGGGGMAVRIGTSIVGGTAPDARGGYSDAVSGSIGTTEHPGMYGEDGTAEDVILTSGDLQELFDQGYFTR